MKKWHLLIIFLSQAAVYRNKTRVDINACSVRVVKLYLENLLKNNGEESFLDNFRFKCVVTSSSNITLECLSHGGFNFLSL